MPGPVSQTCDDDAGRRGGGSRAAPCRPAVYLMALETRFCSTRRSSRRSERTHGSSRHYAQSKPFLPRQRLELDLQLLRTCRRWRNSSISGSQRPVSSREISIRALRISSTASSEASILRASVASSAGGNAARRGSWHRAAPHSAAAECRGSPPPETASCRDWPRRPWIWHCQRLVDLHQLGGALAHAPLQRLVGARQRLGGGDALGDVGIGGHDAALGHGAGADLEDALAAVEPLLEASPCVTASFISRSATTASSRPPRLEVAALGADAQDLIERHADLPELRRQVQELAELRGSSRSAACPCRTRACPGRPDRARIAGGRGCTAAPRRRRRAASAPMAADIAAPQQQRQDEPRRRSADRARQQMLGEAQQVDIGFAPRAAVGTVAAAAYRRTSARPARRRDSAPTVRLQVADGDRGAPAAGRRAPRRAREVVLRRRDAPAAARSGSGARSSETVTIGQHVDGQAPDHAVGERVEAACRTGPAAAGSRSRTARRCMMRARSHAGFDEPGQQQRVGPHREPGDDAGDGAASRCALRQISPPKKAGANCAMAANETRPIEASAVRSGRAAGRTYSRAA